MMGLLDANASLYLLGGRLAEPLPAGEDGVSVITAMELLVIGSFQNRQAS